MKVRLDRLFFYAVSVTVIILLLCTYSGLSRWMGAHPFWAIQVVIIGAAIGAAAAFILAAMRKEFRWFFALSLCLLIITFAVTWYGKMRFVASFAEDGIAGQVWYLGSMASSAAVFLCLFLVCYWVIARFIKPTVA